MNKIKKYIIGGMIGIQGLVTLMSPTHPVAVYPYLASNAIETVRDKITGEEKFNKEELESFLTSREQVELYRKDLVEDLKDESSEKGFVILRNRKGNLEQKSVKTIHENMSDFVPKPIRNYLDRHCITRLDNLIDIEEQGNEILADGHYHVFGETPSKGDKFYRNIRNQSSIIIVNGVVPLIYDGNNFIPFNQNIIKDIVAKEFKTLVPYNIKKEYLNLSYLQNKDIKEEYRKFNLDFSNSIINFINLIYYSDITSANEIKKGLKRECDSFFDLYSKGQISYRQQDFIEEQRIYYTFLTNKKTSKNREENITKLKEAIVKLGLNKNV